MSISIVLKTILSMKHNCMCLGAHICAFLLSIPLRVVLLGHGVFSFSKQLPASFPKYLKFILPPAVYEGSVYAIYSPTPFYFSQNGIAWWI